MRRFVSATDGKTYELDPDKKYFETFGQDFAKGMLNRALAVYRDPGDPIRRGRATLNSDQIVAHWTDLDR